MQRREVTRGSIARTEERANTGRTGEAGKQIQIGEAREKRDERATKDKFSRRLNRIKMKKDKIQRRDGAGQKKGVQSWAVMLDKTLFKIR